MRGLTSIGAAILLIGIAGWMVSKSGAGATAFALAAASCVLLFRGIQGHGLKTSAGEASNTIDFVRNPAGTIVESAIDTIGDLLDDERKKAEPESTFDADAAFARYMANRPEQAAPVPGIQVAPVQAQFGRKGLTTGS